MRKTLGVDQHRVRMGRILGFPRMAIATTSSQALDIISSNEVCTAGWTLSNVMDNIFQKKFIHVVACDRISGFVAQ